MKIFPVLFLAAALSACASSSKTYGPDGRVAYAISCRGAVQTWASCYERAGDICGAAGYDVVSINGETGFVAGGSGAGAFGGTTHSRSMVISCKN